MMFPFFRGYYTQYYCQTLKTVSRLSRSSQQIVVLNINHSSGFIVSISVADIEPSSIDS